MRLARAILSAILITIGAPGPLSAAAEAPTADPLAEAVVRYEQGDFVQAIKALKPLTEAGKLPPAERARALRYLGYACAMDLRDKEAKDAFKALIQIEVEKRIDEKLDRKIVTLYNEAYAELPVLSGLALGQVEFRPYLEKGEVRFNIQGAAAVKLTLVSDGAGEVFAAESDSKGGAVVISWNGRGNGRSIVKSGSYVLRLEAKNESGNVFVRECPVHLEISLPADGAELAAEARDYPFLPPKKEITAIPGKPQWQYVGPTPMKTHYWKYPAYVLLGGPGDLLHMISVPFSATQEGSWWLFKNTIKDFKMSRGSNNTGEAVATILMAAVIDTAAGLALVFLPFRGYCELVGEDQHKYRLFPIFRRTTFREQDPEEERRRKQLVYSHNDEVLREVASYNGSVQGFNRDLLAAERSRRLSEFNARIRAANERVKESVKVRWRLEPAR